MKASSLNPEDNITGDTAQASAETTNDAGASSVLRPADERFVPFVLVFLGCVYSSLLLLSDLLPFVDLPFHLGVATVVRGYGEAGNQFSDYFTLQIAGQPNVFYLWFCSLSIFPSVEFANKVYFSLYSFLLPMSLYAVIRQLRGNTWFSVLGFLYLYNFNTHWGFVGFVGAMPAVVFLFALVLRHLREPTALTYVGIAVGALCLFFIHVLGALFFLCVYGLTCLLLYGADRKQFAKSMLLIVPTVVLVGGWWIGTVSESEQSLGEFLMSYYQDSYARSFRVRSFFFIFDNSYLAGGRQGLIWGGLIAALSMSFIGWAAVLEWKTFLPTLKERRFRPAIAFVLGAAFCFLCLPEGLPGQWALNQRFSVYFILGVIALSSVFELKMLPRPLVIAVILSGCLVHAALYADYFRDFGEETDGFAEAILPVAGETRLAGLILEPHFRGTLSYLHFSNYYIVRRQGIAVSRMVDFRFGTVRRKEDGSDLPEAMMRFDISPDYAGEYDEIDYLMVRGEISPSMRDSLNNFEESNRHGKWSLLVKR